ncbi:MAG: hypothetical protein HY561_02040, partial [Gemmatimonadetes bacterium]|nr:hypothetical protein [Gemmatimonadota bacterium]
AELTAEDAGTLLRYEVRARPRTLLGLAAIPVQIGWLSRRRFGAVLERYGRMAAMSERPMAGPAPRVTFAPGGRERLEAARTSLRTRVRDRELADRLADLVASADELTLARLRPYACADAWGVPRRRTLELFLHATRAGLLELQWDLVCPMCRGAKETSGSLRDVGSTVHCDSCQIDFTVEFERSVELTFRASPAIRPIDVFDFCVGGPQVTPHIVVQQLLAPGERRTLMPALEPGRYRLRARGRMGARPLEVGDGGAPAAELRLDDDGAEAPAMRITTSPSIVLENAGKQACLAMLERTAWSDQAATAAEVTTLQEFRDLFSQEALRPGEHISVGSLAVLFTDLRGSSRLYREVGDAPAFGRVMNHFDVLREHIAAGDGAIVKTMGDAVMAVFRRPAGAISAVFAAQRALMNPPAGMQPLVLKAGLHFGSCIAVTLNDRLDYFGSTVNLAARLGGVSVGGEIVISEVVRRDPEVAAWLEGQAGLTCESFEAMLRGFDDLTLRLWRITQA